MEEALGDVCLDGPADAVGPLALSAARHIGGELVVFLIELVKLNLALTRAAIVTKSDALGAPVDFALELKHGSLLLLADRD